MELLVYFTSINLFSYYPIDNIFCLCSKDMSFNKIWEDKNALGICINGN